MAAKFSTLATKSWVWWTAVVLYGLMVITILSPVLVWSFANEDAHQFLIVWVNSGDSYWHVVKWPFVFELSFEGDQLRTQPIFGALSHAWVLFSFKVSTALSLPPLFMNAVLKIVLLVLAYLGVFALLKTWTFRDAQGNIRQFSQSTVGFVLIMVPAVIAVGAKAQKNDWTNGWLAIPIWSYAPFVIFALLIAGSLALNHRLEISFKKWLVPTVVIMVLASVVINLSYEIIALAVPLICLVLLMTPRPDIGGFWMRWRSRLVIAFSLGFPYTVLFGWIRWRLSQMQCIESGTCYDGTVVEFDLPTIWRNLWLSTPLGTRRAVAIQAENMGHSFPAPDSTSVLLGTLLALSMLTVWFVWKRQNGYDTEVLARNAREETRGLMTLVSVLAILVFGTSIISAITSKAVVTLAYETNAAAYRTGVLVWTALSVGFILIMLVLFGALKNHMRVHIPFLLALFVMVITSVFFPRNLMSLQAHRIGEQVSDTFHHEIVLGDVSDIGDRRRCQFLNDQVIPALEKNPDWYIQGRLDGAYVTFNAKYGQPFCSDERFFPYLTAYVAEQVAK